MKTRKIDVRMNVLWMMWGWVKYGVVGWRKKEGEEEEREEDIHERCY